MKRLLSSAAALLLFTMSAFAADPINIISIVTDDQAAWTVGAYGNKECKTPNMDRLAREGALFENAFANTPVCSPNRTTLLTGRFGTEFGITDYISMAENQRGVGLPKDCVTWPRLLQSAGYRTALVGKWHVGATTESHPLRQGFDRFYGFLGGGNSPMNPQLQLDHEPMKRLTGSLPDLLTDHAIQWIDDAPTSKPFALLLHFRAPHMRYKPVPEADSAPYEDLDPTIPDSEGLDKAKVKEWTKDYYGSVHSVDRNLGRLLAHLDAAGLTSNTVVVFSSDHGYNIGHHTVNTKGNGNWIAGGVGGPKRPNMWDTSLRMPLIVRWPGVVKSGVRVQESVSTVDVFPTMLAVAGVSQPQETPVRGRSFLPLLKGSSEGWDNTVYGQYDLHNGGLAYMRMIRTPEFKLVRHYKANYLDELYDLKSDPGEEKNLFRNPQQAPVVRKLQEKLTAWQRAIGDPLLPEVEAAGQLVPLVDAGGE